MWSAVLCCLLIGAPPTTGDSEPDVETPGAFGELAAFEQPPSLLSQSVSEDRQWLEELPTLPSTQVTASYLPKFSETGFGIASLDLRHSFLLGYDDWQLLSITPGVTTHGWSSPAALDLPTAAYDIYLDLHGTPWRGDATTVSLGVTSGLYSDFRSLDSDALQWSGWLLASRQLSPEWTLLGGAAYVRQWRGTWLPLAGLSWTPNDRTRWELFFPRPRVAHLCRADGNWTHWVYLAGQFGGGAWSIADTPDNNVLVGYSDLRLTVGWEAFSWRGYEWRAELGYAFARDLSVNHVSVNSPRDTLFVQGSFAF